MLNLDSQQLISDWTPFLIAASCSSPKKKKKKKTGLHSKQFVCIFVQQEKWAQIRKSSFQDFYFLSFPLWNTWSQCGKFTGVQYWEQPVSCRMESRCCCCHFKASGIHWERHNGKQTANVQATRSKSHIKSLFTTCKNDRNPKTYQDSWIVNGSK